MTILNREQIESIILLVRTLPDDKLSAILDELQNELPAVYRFIYGEPSDAIASLNQDMANLYMDLSFDVIWVFQKAFGNPPNIEDNEKWVINKLALLDAELKSLISEIPMDTKFRKNLQERFIQRSFDTSIQIELLEYLRREVIEYASFDAKREQAVDLTANLLLILVRLFGDLYSFDAKHR